MINSTKEKKKKKKEVRFHEVQLEIPTYLLLNRP
jgi:hypothetical protein